MKRDKEFFLFFQESLLAMSGNQTPPGLTPQETSKAKQNTKGEKLDNLKNSFRLEITHLKKLLLLLHSGSQPSQRENRNDVPLEEVSYCLDGR